MPCCNQSYPAFFDSIPHISGHKIRPARGVIDLTDDVEEREDRRLLNPKSYGKIHVTSEPRVRHFKVKPPKPTHNFSLKGMVCLLRLHIWNNIFITGLQFLPENAHSWDVKYNINVGQSHCVIRRVIYSLHDKSSLLPLEIIETFPVNRFSFRVFNVIPTWSDSLSEAMADILKMKKKKHLILFSFEACRFCGRTDDNEEEYGKIFDFEKGKVHYYCMVRVLFLQSNTFLIAHYLLSDRELPVMQLIGDCWY